MRWLSQFLRGLIALIFTIVLILLGLRFIFRLFNVNADTGFVAWVRDLSAEIMAPFRGIFPPQNLEGFVVEFSILFAILAYGILALLVIFLINILTPEPDRHE